MVDGVITFIDGVHTGALPGKLVRNPLTFAADQRTNLADVYAPLHRFKPTYLSDRYDIDSPLMSIPCVCDGMKCGKPEVAVCCSVLQQAWHAPGPLQATLQHRSYRD